MPESTGNLHWRTYQAQSSGRSLSQALSLQVTSKSTISMASIVGFHVAFTQAELRKSSSRLTASSGLVT
eukprot:3619039-Rhodomonas_salina.1